ncbi:protein timeless homolog isoform X3 [Amia ocellicauda]|uniref:protein timeless homolog isoform X3 n=1 Tax=Amia ocellicauda TaxID=2972642 RepID=UPI003464E66A
MDLYMMNCELLATCSALGYLEGETYHREPDCLESVKDLIRYLRHEDDTRDIRQQLGAGQILQNDLLPIIIQHSQEKQLFDACIRLMVNLTQPALLCFGKVPDDSAFRHHFLQIVSYLQAYKQAFANEKVFGVLSEKLYNLLQMEWEQREEEDNLLIERILLLVRNVLHIPADPYEEKTVDDDASIHDKLLWAMHMSGMDDLLKFLASAPSEQQWSLHVLEVISLMFRDQTPEQLVSAGQSRSVQEKQKDAQELEVLRQKEIAEKRSRVLQRGSRHSRFGGSYVVQGLKSLGDKDVIYHKGLHNFKNYSHDMGKAVRRVPKRRQRARDPENCRRSALNVRLFLREFCIDFLENCYNRLMYLVKDGLLREKAQQHDETYYLWALAFFMGFNRSHNFRMDLVSETMSVRTFHYIERNLTNYYEMMLTDRKEATSWARRMHLALKAYRELLMTVNEMDHSRDDNIRQSASVIKSNIFYLMEYREIFLTLLRKFDETKQPRSFLKDLVEAAHLFLRMLERFCKGRNNLVVQRKRVKKKRSKGKRRSGPAVDSSPEALEQCWQVVSEELKATGFQLSESVTEGTVLFDAASEVPLEEQRAEAMVRIQDALLAKQGPEALALIRAAREVWPEGDVFGAADVVAEEELELLKQILFANLPRPATTEPVEEEEEVGEGEEEEEIESVRVSEAEFNFLDYIKRFASPNILQPYLLLLKSYNQNSTHTNHCIVRMLHRVAVDLKMDALLFQLSVFCLFNKILCDPAATAYKELVTFAKFVLNRFFALAARNNKAYVELLFWKNVGAVREMTEGYSKEEDKQESKKRVTWSSEEEAELGKLYLEHRDSGDADVVETLLPILSNPSWTRRQVVQQLVNLGLVDSVKDLKKQRKGTRIVLWTEDQELELQTLFEEFSESDDILGNILKKITAKRSRARVVDKLLSLGLVSDRKELYKKRRPRAAGKSSGMTEDEFFSDLAGETQNDPSDEEEEEEEEEESEGEESEEQEQRDEPREREGKRRVAASQGRTDGNLVTLVQKLRQEGLSGPLLWLQNCLNRTADDREEDGLSQPVPLVPLTEENEDAMENKSFHRLLCRVGIRKPANEQESFWRIPAKLNPAQLRATAASLSAADEGPAGGSEGQETPVEEKDVDDPEQRAQALRALLLARKRRRPHTTSTEVQSLGQSADEAQESTSDSETTRVPEASVECKASMKRSRVLDSDEEREEEEADSLAPMDLGAVDPDSEAEDLAAPAKRRRHRALIDDEEEED